MPLPEDLYPAGIARCQHIKTNGVQCNCPALKNQKLCYFHHKAEQRRVQVNENRWRRSAFPLQLPLLEDPESIQIAIMQVTRLLLTHQIDHKTAGLLLYALQTASANLAFARFQPRPERVVIDRRRVSETLIGDDAWSKQEFEEAEEPVDSANPSATVDIQAFADPFFAHSALSAVKIKPWRKRSALARTWSWKTASAWSRSSPSATPRPRAWS